MRSFTTKKTVTVLAGISITALALAGCQDPTSIDSPDGEMDAAVGESTESTSESLEGSMDAATAEAEGLAAADAPAELPDWTIDSPAEGTDAYVAWEALMGPEGEYAALASYQAVLDEYGQVEPYATIKDAEAQHAEALIRQLERMGVEVPGNPYLGLIAAPADLTTAAAAWAVGEVANVELYDRLIEQTDDANLIRVFENLRRASAEAHLPAFELAAENGGTLDPEQMSGIQMMHSDGERGQGGGPGHDHGDDATHSGEGQMQRHGQHQESSL
jgi:hypothetical protein